MINPFVFGLAFVAWFLSFTATAQAFPFAIGLTIYYVVVTLFVAPTVPRGKLPDFDDIYIRTFCNCFKLNHLKDNDADVIPSIASGATHLLFGIDTSWTFDTSLGKIIDSNQSDPKIVKYLKLDPLERSQRVFTDDITEVSKAAVAESAKEFITTHIQRVRTIPLSINPSNYLTAVFNLDASIQSFVHFPLKFWNAAMTMNDITVYFPAPRGAQFFFQTSIIGIRKKVHQSDSKFADLDVDIQTTISIDRNRLEKLYSEEDNYDAAEREYISRLQNEDDETKAKEIEQYEKLQQQQQLERKKKLLLRPPQLALVARVINTYSYNNVIDVNKWDPAQQTQFPHKPDGDFEAQFDQICEEKTNKCDKNGKNQSRRHPQLTLAVDSKSAIDFANAMGNSHPRMQTGIVSTLFGYNATNNNQVDVSYATYIALNVYHAMINDNLGAGLSKSAFSKVFKSNKTTLKQKRIEKGDENVQNSHNDDESDENENDGNETEDKKEFLYPYRCILQTCAQINAPADIQCFISPVTDADGTLEHRGYTYSKHLLERQKAKTENKNKHDDEKSTAVVEEAPQEISTDAFPQFLQKQLVTLTIADGNDQIVWAKGAIFTQPASIL
jgi:hypothetical protein